jgi:hypothetical protein
MSPTNLKRSHKIHSLVADLGIKATTDPVRDIVRFCEKRVARFLKDFPDCKTLSQLLDISASKLGTKFEEIHSDDHLNDVRTRYLQNGEKSFASLHEELSPEVFGVTFKRLSRKPWELPYVSVIDCRQDKKYRSYYTKWHELGHLLILTDQMRLAFRRTHFGLDDKDPEETLVDVIAGAFGFLPDLIKPVAKGRPSFEEIEVIRMQLCPEASQQASIIGISRAWPTACILLQAQMGLKRGESRDIAQGDLGFQERPKEVLRATQVSPNDAARASNLVIFPNMRVPDRSIIHKVFTGSAVDGQAVEDLAWWESSDGSRLPSVKVLVEARSGRDGIRAIITPK